MTAHRATRPALIAVTALTLGTGAFVALPASPAQAATVKTYANCTALVKDYPHGVANKDFTTAQWKARGATAKPKYAPKVYQANTKSDRDKDGIACER